MTTRQRERDGKEVAGASWSATLTPAQRLHFDVYGFVLLENVLTPEEVASLKAALYRLKAEPDLEALGVHAFRRTDHYFHVAHVLEYDQSLLDYATHPRLLPLVEEIVGGSVRLEETEAIINSRDPNREASDRQPKRIEPLGFHCGTRHGWGTYYQHHHFRCLFVKTLAYLTDVGPDDGGTAVIPGSHRLRWKESDIIEAALADPALLHQVEAKAGSVLLFPEALVHSTTAIRSDHERVVSIAGYTPPMLREWPGHEPSPEFVQSLPEETRRLVTGADSWYWKRSPDD